MISEPPTSRWVRLLSIGLLLLSAAAPNVALATDIIVKPNGNSALRFAASEIERAQQDGKSSLSEIALEVSGAGPAQSYRIERDSAKLRVVGADNAGAMYGGLDVAEAIRLGTVEALKPGERRPFIAQRGIKFNIPLDLRTPGYSDNSDAFQANIPEMWSREFWREFLDEMARQRFNVLSLWNLHPFPSIVKVPEYPEVALNDVLRGRRECFDANFPHDGRDMFRPEFLEGAEVIKHLTIDDKIAFWREVMQMARDRGIDVYWFTWNTFLYGAEGKHGLNRAKPDDNLVRYFRASVRETVKTYPLLAGIGITAGEFMSEKLGGLPKEQWLWQTYGEGIRDALRSETNRPFRLIHRFHQSDMSGILREWKDYPGPFDFSYKYAVAHMYASTRPPFIEPLLKVLPKTHRTWLTVRNDDIYSFRWGDPAFAREFIKAMPGPEAVSGFYMGPDGYCWGRDFLSKPATNLNAGAANAVKLVMQKQWFSFMLWGRLAYDPTLPDSHFEKVLATHFPGVSADRLLAAWSAASRIFPEITRFHWGNIDLKWFPEACLSHPRHKGFYTVRHFIEGETMEGSGNLDIRQWREQLLSGKPMPGTTPLQVAANLRRHADEALAASAQIKIPKREIANETELRLTLGDIEAFAHLGSYYAAKIEGACELALFDANGQPDNRDKAVKHLTAALNDWRAYAACYTRQYRQPILYNRVGWVDIPKLAEKVSADIDIALQWKPGSVVPRPAAKGKGSLFGQ